MFLMILIMLAFFRRRRLISTWLLLLRRIKCDFYFHLNTIWKQICWVTILFYSYKKWHGMEIIVTCWVQLQPKDFLKLKSLNLHEGTFWRWIDLCWQVCSVSIQKRHVICIIFFLFRKKGYLFLSLSSSRYLCPHFFHIFKYHIAMPVKCLDTSQKFFVVTTVDQDLSSIFDRLCYDW